jgi:hypothetical protein
LPGDKPAWDKIRLRAAPGKKQNKMSSKSKIQKKRVALGLSKLTPTQVVVLARHISQSMTGNAIFPNPTPALTTIDAQAAALEAGYSLTLTRAKGSVDQMHVERKTLTTSLMQLASYVEVVANANPDNASSIIGVSGMPEKKPMVRKPKGFSVTAGKDPASVKITTQAVKRGIYVYEMTTDPATATSWAVIYTGNTVKFLKTGLTSGTRYYFRYAVITAGVQGNWSPVVNFMVA